MKNIDIALELIAKNDYALAKKYFAYARRDNPQDWRAWFGLAQVLTNNFQNSNNNWLRFVETAFLYANDDDKEFMKEKMGNYYELYQQISTEKKNQESSSDSKVVGWVIFACVMIFIVILLAGLN